MKRPVFIAGICPCFLVKTNGGPYLSIDNNWPHLVSGLYPADKATRGFNSPEINELLLVNKNPMDLLENFCQGEKYLVAHDAEAMHIVILQLDS